MEEQLTSLLTNILAEIPKKIDSKILEKYYQLFDEKKYIGSNFELIYKDIQENYHLSLQSLRCGYNSENEKEIYKNLIFALINEKEKKEKTKLIPLIIYLDNDRVLYDYLYQINYFDNFVESIKDFFVGTVKDSGIKISNIEQLPFYHLEKEWLERYSEGIENLNFQQIYSFVEEFERDKGFNFDIYTDFSTFITYKYFSDDLINIANSKKDMFEIIYLLNILTVEESLILAKSSNSYLLKFEVIRKAVYFKNNNHSCLNLLKSEQELVTNIIIEFTEDEGIWKQFLDYYLYYPLRNPQLFKLLSKVIERIDKKTIDILVETIKLDQFINDDSKEALNSCFLHIEESMLQEHCLELLFRRWEAFLDNPKSIEYFGGIVLTDVIDIVIVYVREFLNKNIIFEKVKEILYKLDEIDNRWFKNQSEKSNYFYKEMSKLFIYGFSFDKYNFFELKHQVSDICKTSIELQNESHHDKKTTLQLFNEYILLEDTVKCKKT